jgi:hypothetical protein
VVVKIQEGNEARMAHPMQHGFGSHNRSRPSKFVRISFRGHLDDIETEER